MWFRFQNIENRKKKLPQTKTKYKHFKITHFVIILILTYFMCAYQTQIRFSHFFVKKTIGPTKSRRRR